MNQHIVVFGADGRVGEIIVEAAHKEGWVVEPAEWPYEGHLGGKVVADCLPAQHALSRVWEGYFANLARTVGLIQMAEVHTAKAMVIPSTEWATDTRAPSPYIETKLLIEQLARTQNRCGTVPIIVDRIGCIPYKDEELTRWERSLVSDQIGERIISAVLKAIGE